MRNVDETLKSFKKFTDEEIHSAILELDKISQENNRKHLQRLVYINLINRFDTLVDNLLLYFGTNDQNDFRDIVLETTKDLIVSSKDFYQIILSDDPRSKANERVEDLIRSHFLRDRHSKKLRVLLESCLHADPKDLDRPRVNANDGRIHSTYTPRDNSVPPSIIGYADYLYSRRNGLTHGDGNLKILSIDAKYMERCFKIHPPQFIGIKLSSIKSASRFYSYIGKFIKTGKWPSGRGF